MKRILAFLSLIGIFLYCSAATKLFETGWEDGIELLTYRCCGGQWWGEIRGGVSPRRIPQDMPFESVEGFQWQLWHKLTNFLIVDTPEEYIFQRFKTVTGRLGSPTTVLYTRNIKDYVAPPLHDDVPASEDDWRLGNPRSNWFAQPESLQNKQLYMSYWMKLPPYFLDFLSSGDSTHIVWLDLWEFKTYQLPACEGFGIGGHDSRISCVINYRGCCNDPPRCFPGFHWSVSQDTMTTATCVNDGTIPRVFGDITCDDVVPIPIDTWFKFEVFWKQAPDTTGRIWVRVNGSVICDRHTWTYREPGLFCHKWNIFKNYTDEEIRGGQPNGLGSPQALEILYDDLEFWDSIPPP
jgi:hypothetical protein